jgi:hypothetical protein
MMQQMMMQSQQQAAAVGRSIVCNRCLPRLARVWGNGLVTFLDVDRASSWLWSLLRVVEALVLPSSTTTTTITTTVQAAQQLSSLPPLARPPHPLFLLVRFPAFLCALLHGFTALICFPVARSLRVFLPGDSVHDHRNVNDTLV